MIFSWMTKKERTELRRKWIEALRSGKYPQTERYLHDKKGYCCLGVACEVAGAICIEQDDGVFAYENTPNRKEYLKIRALPSHLVYKYGLHDFVGSFSYEQVPDKYKAEMKKRKMPDRVTLASLNDYGWTFDEIADFIEDCSEIVFKN